MRACPCSTVRTTPEVSDIRGACGRRARDDTLHGLTLGVMKTSSPPADKRERRGRDKSGRAPPPARRPPPVARAWAAGYFRNECPSRESVSVLYLLIKATLVNRRCYLSDDRLAPTLRVQSVCWRKYSPWRTLWTSQNTILSNVGHFGIAGMRHDRCPDTSETQGGSIFTELQLQGYFNEFYKILAFAVTT
ncbi:hypothetical protein EVAR_72268_1 [Eumeta japonica]|uniref:Uncharacterized protein n=1 Tax=Eumeta variegata TaxID=151549 RepID=A0A4C1TDJ0_EUMVA|nr:hypothetical protein EVAR_72268_1 [Eumeta japonica]